MTELDKQKIEAALQKAQTELQDSFNYELTPEKVIEVVRKYLLEL